MWSTSLGPNDYRNTKDLDPKALLRGCLPPRSWLSTVLSELRGGRHPLKSAPTSNYLSFLSSLGPKLVLHISGCLKNPPEYLVISWLAIRQPSRLSVYQFQKFQISEMWSTTPCPSIQLNLCTYLISGVAGRIRFIFWEVKIGTGRFVIKYKTHPSVAN